MIVKMASERDDKNQQQSQVIRPPPSDRFPPSHDCTQHDRPCGDDNHGRQINAREGRMIQKTGGRQDADRRELPSAAVKSLERGSCS